MHWKAKSARPKVYFRPLIDVLKAITADKMGEDALKEALKKIVVRNVGGVRSASSWASFESGTLTLDHEPCTNVDDVQQRAVELRKLLEKSL